MPSFRLSNALTTGPLTSPLHAVWSTVLCCVQYSRQRGERKRQPHGSITARLQCWHTATQARQSLATCTPSKAAPNTVAGPHSFLRLQTERVRQATSTPSMVQSGAQPSLTLYFTSRSAGTARRTSATCCLQASTLDPPSPVRAGRPPLSPTAVGQPSKHVPPYWRHQHPNHSVHHPRQRFNPGPTSIPACFVSNCEQHFCIRIDRKQLFIYETYRKSIVALKPSSIVLLGSGLPSKQCAFHSSI